MPTVSGIIDKVIYKNTDNGYTVAALETPDGELTVVGLLPLVTEGEQIEVEGEYKLNPKHGQQFEVSSFLSRLPVEETAILRYLSSGIVKGVRAKTAKLLVDAFGPNTLDIIENNPEMLVEIRGISPEKAEKISQSMKETVGVKTILLYFQQFGMTPSVAFKIYKQFGLYAYDVVRQNPYRICEIPGVSFEKADRMAEQMGYDRTSAYRLKAGIEYILNQNLFNNGHTFIPKQKLIPLAAEFLDTDQRTVEDRIDEMCAPGGDLQYVPQIGNTDGVYLRWVYDSERNITNRVLLASRLGTEYPGNFNKDIARIERDLALLAEARGQAQMTQRVREERQKAAEAAQQFHLTDAQLAKQSPKKLYVLLPTRKEMEQVKAIASQYPGGYPVYMKIQDEGIALLLSRDYWFDGTEEPLEKLCALFGKDGVVYKG